MKISSASKKVLASALSAAMVVAFAPTVAFGAVNEGDTVKVKFDTTGLTLQNGSSPFAEKDYIVGTNNIVNMGANFAANHVYKSGDNEIDWYFDANGNGVLDGSEALVNNGQFTIDPATDLADGTVTLTYKVREAFTVTTFDNNWAAPNNGYTGDWFPIKIVEAGIYSATLVKNGTEIASMPIQNVAANGEFAKWFTIVDEVNETNKATNGCVAKDAITEGTYTLTVTNAAGKKVVKSFTVVKISLSGIFGAPGSEKSGQTVYAYKGQTLHQALVNFKAYPFSGDASAVKYVDGNAKKATAYTLNGVNVETLSGDTLTEAVATELKGDVVLGTVYEDEVDPTLTLDGKTIKLKLGNVTGGTNYKAVITVNGTEYPTVQNGTAWGTATEIYSFGSAGAAGGTYNVVVYEQTAAGTGTIEKKVAEKAIDLAAVTLDAGEGKLATNQKANLGVFQAGTLYKDNAGVTGNEVLTGVAAPTPNDATAKFLGWSLDGVNVLKAADKVAAGTAAVTLKAIYSSVKAAAPTYEWANDTLTLANAAGDGYKVYYQYSADNGVTYGTATEYTGPIQLKKGSGAAIKAWTQKTTANTSGKANSAEIVIVNSAAAKQNLENAIDALILTETVTTSDSTSNAPKYYETVLKDQIAAVKAVITDKAFATSGENGDWAKLVKQQTLAVLQLVADYETAQIDTLAAGVKAADGTVKKIGTAAADKQKAVIAQVITDWNYYNDDDNATVASKIYANGYVAAIKKAAADAADAATTYKAADVTAAEAVTAQLKAAKTGAEAQAALAAYEALTTAQKELVAAADIAAAQAVAVKAAEEEAAAQLVKEQDIAAVKYVNSTKTKTVKLATAKKAKTVLTYKSQVSASGNKVTYAKKSGNAKIKVAANGKVTLAKVTKKGTYKAKVLVTCGEQTRTVTAKFIVK